MESILNHPSGETRNVIDQAASIMIDGGLVVFPTETVYGVGASAAVPQGIGALRTLKNRTDGKPFTVHLGHPDYIKDYVEYLPRQIERLVRKTFPGPITLLLHVENPQNTITARKFGSDCVKELYCDGWIGVRCPDHHACRDLLLTVDQPVVAASANPQSDPPSTSAQDAARLIGDSVDMILDAGQCKISVASTIARVSDSDTIEIVRSGQYDLETLKRLMDMHYLFVCTGNTCRSPMAEVLCKQVLQKTLNDTSERPGDHQISSAGVFASAGSPASDGARQAMLKRGIELGNHRSQPLSSQLANDADVIYCMTESHRQGVLAIAPEAADRCFLLDEKDIADPIGGNLEIYEQCAMQIEACIRRIIQEEQR